MSSLNFLSFTLISSLLVISSPLSIWVESKGCSINAIYSFGDSIADTGNLLREGPVGFFASIGSYPYGQSYKKPTGRCSDGLLIIDYLAMDLNLPLINPYLDKSSNFSNGVNFAVAGATALDRLVLLENGIGFPPASVPLSSQLEWFNSYLNSTCSSQSDCAQKIEQALFLVGEIGGNDYNYAFFQGASINQAMNYVPQVVQSIIDAAKHVISLGARQLVVPGNFPIGCSPSYLTLYSTTNSSAYDEKKCLKDYNNFSMYHNKQLKAALVDLRKSNPDVTIIYADYYEAFMHMLDQASSLGFEEDSMLTACCGTGGGYNYESNLMCGSPGTTVCSNPDQHISWDGIHLTQAAYMVIAQSLVTEGFAYPSDKVQEIWDC
ncbi:acetylajmalan esterase-like protein [Carex littledalei]|uniref:Acetylajmalan esterase-like protein n=1 Tax=Carex littledalei TaxID=544730 RepID=A0A833VTE8_9POAL|nr:acetylajmalan esterase-like protein [Carex littledalei]